MMNSRILILIPILLFATSGYAATYDLQPDTLCIPKYDNCKIINEATQCDLINYCESTFDLLKIGLTTNQLNNLKSQNLTSYLPKVSETIGLKNMSYSISGNTLILRGYASNAYWSFDLPNGYGKLDPFWGNNSYNYSITYSVSSVAQGTKGIIFNISASTPKGYRCGREALFGGLANGSIVPIKFYRNGCNATASELVWYFYTAPTGSNMVNISLYSGNLTPVVDYHKCDSTTTISCDNEAFTGYSARNGGSVGSIEPQQDYVKEGSYGWKIQTGSSWNQYFKANNLSASTMSPTRMIINYYGYGASVSHYLQIADATGAAGSVITNRVNAGQLQNYAWSNVAGLVLNAAAFNTLVYDFDASGKMNITMLNASGAFAVNTLAMVGVTATNQVAHLMGGDAGSLTLYGDAWAYFDYSAISHAYLVNETQPAPAVAASVNLSLNGNYTNITLSNSTSLNSTAFTNLTGGLVYIEINGTVYSSGYNSVINLTNLSAGIYNITAYVPSNSSVTGATLTRWANMTYAASSAPSSGSSVSITYNVDLNDAPLTCLNATHAQRNTTIYNNGTAIPLGEVYRCPNGCDNVTSSCSPSPYEADVYNMIIIILIIAAVIILLRRRW